MVGDPCLPSAEIEAQLPQLAPQLPSEGLAEEDPFLGEQVNIALDLTEVVVREREQPVLDLLLEFDRTPGHSANAISARRHLGLGRMPVTSVGATDETRRGHLVEADRGSPDGFMDTVPHTGNTPWMDGWMDGGVLTQLADQGKRQTLSRTSTA